jgi:hypothetical protein
MNLKSIFSIGLISLFGMLLLSSCMKEKSMDAVIIVKLHHDTDIVVPYAEVRISAPINQSANPDITDIVGYTDLNGEFRQTFDLPVQLDIMVTKDSLSGIGTLNMNDPGAEIRKYVYIY